MKKIVVATIGILAFLYLVYPSFGIFELIPDNIPFIGNLDEGGATFLLLNALSYFGLDLTNVFGWGGKTVKRT